MGHLIAHVVGGHQVADEVVLGMRLALDGHGAHPVRQLEQGLLRLLQHLWCDERQRVGDDGLGQLPEAQLVAARRRDAGDPADDRAGDRIGELGHEVDHPGASVQRRGEACHDLVDVSLHACDRLRGEGGGDQAAYAAVVVGSECQQVVVLEPADVTACGRRLVVLPRPLVGRGHVAVGHEALDVVVTRDEPQRHGFDVVHGILLAQPGDLPLRVEHELGREHLWWCGHLDVCLLPGDALCDGGPEQPEPQAGGQRIYQDQWGTSRIG